MDSRLPRPERDRTDESLRTERKNTDRALAETRTHIEEAADDVLQRARDHADAALDSAREQASDSEEGRRTAAAMERFQRYVARMNRLIGDLVDVASVDAGKLGIEPQPFDAVQLICEAIEAFGHAAQDKAISLVYDSSERS